MNKTPYYLTTAIAYTSGKPHIGNCYEIVLADSIVRYKRSKGYDVFFQTGTDEHGLKIEQKADAAGITPQQFVDEVAGIIKGQFDLLNVSYDKFIRTTDPDHMAQVQKIFKKLYEQGDIYKGYYEGWYCVPDEAFFTESQVVDGKCPDCGRPLVRAREEAYFFKMSKYADRLIEHIRSHPEFIQPESRKNEMMNNFLLPGLQDLCVSRTSFKWGVPVDFDDKHVVYVWLDALTNYITGIGYDADGNHSEQYKKLWPADLHLIGKDILRFHTIYWPIFLMALGEPLPKQVFGHPWLLQGDGKMSIERYNSDLANTLGNLVNRTVAMSNKYFGGMVTDAKAAEPVDEDLKAEVLQAVKNVDKAMDGLHVADALTAIFTAFKRCNKYIDETTPWALAKDEAKKERLQTVLYNLTEGITIGASLLHSFLPETAERIAAQLNTGLRSDEELGQFGLYPSGTQVTDKPEILFARLDPEKTMAQIREKFGPKEEPAEAAPAEAEAAEPEKQEIALELKPEITYEDFEKMQFAIGEIIACEEVKKSKKLLCSQVKIGDQVRQIVSGIKAWYKPEEMVGKKVMVIVNLKPAKLAGLLSEGMLLCAEDAEGNLALMVPEKDLPAGSEIR